NSIDLLRGFIMIVMALDHTRDFFHTTAWTQDPLNLATTTPFLYFTRWITHLCAPNFVFLAGVSIYFQSLRKTKKELSSFLLKRGVWLVFVEILIVNPEFSFDYHFSFLALQVIWAIGVSMIILGLLIRLPYTAILIIGAIIILGHNMLDYYEAHLKEQPAWWYSMLHMPGIYKLTNDRSLLIFYPFLPWSGLMVMGYCFGKLFLKFDGNKRKKMLILLGCIVLLFFVVLRYTNTYGDPGKWSIQKNSLYTFLSFINLRKYPPSLLYMCATVGLALVFLAFTTNANNRLSRFITVYGRVPFLYYVLHFFLIHAVSAGLFFARGHAVQEGMHTGQEIPNFIIPGEGVSLGFVYLIWICIVLCLYPVCKWFSEYKRTHTNWWLSYL
ncbi:MAG: heparan-alpha-glucosaminide N-acetyltransferase domain-containing protein, partial [Ginsengibacter sp.]